MLHQFHHFAKVFVTMVRPVLEYVIIMLSLYWQIDWLLKLRAFKIGLCVSFFIHEFTMRCYLHFLSITTCTLTRDESTFVKSRLQDYITKTTHYVTYNVLFQ